MSDTIKELWDAFKGQLTDRLANPFTGALTIAWCIFNFRLLVVLIWIESYQQKFTYIDTVLYPSLGHWGIRAVAAPIIAAYAYLLFYPKLTMWAATRYRRMQSQANNEMRAAQGEALMTQEEHRNARAQLARIESQLRADIAEGADRVKRQDDLIELQRVQINEHRVRADRLEAQLAAKNDDPSKKSLASLGVTTPKVPHVGDALDALKEHPPGPADLSNYYSTDTQANSPIPPVAGLPKNSLIASSVDPLQDVINSEAKMIILKVLAQSGSGVEASKFRGMLQRSDTTVRHHLEVLEDLQLVEFARDSDDEAVWYLTKQGRAFAVKNRLVDP